MTQSKESFRSNIYSSIIIPLVDTLNMPNTRAVNPHVKFAIANLLIATTQRWGIRYMQSPTPGLVDRLNPEANDVVTYESNIIGGALSDRVGNPYTSLVEGLRMKLDAKPTSTVNAWVDWMNALDYFFENVTYVDYFLYDYKAGAFKDFYLNASGTAFHKSAFVTGLLFDYIADGQGSVPVKAKTRLTVDTVLSPADESTYMIVYQTPTLAQVLTIQVDGVGVAPSLTPPPGVTYEYHYLELLSTDSALVNAVNIRNQVNLATGLKATAVSDLVLDIEAGENAVVTATDGSNLPAHGTWGFTFTNGTPSIGAPEKVKIDYKYAKASELKDRFFIVYDSLGASAALWYNVNGNGTAPKKCSECVQCNPCVPDVDAIISIDILSTFTNAQVLEATRRTLSTFGVFNLAVSGTVLTLTYLDTGSVQDIDPGTAMLGINYNYDSKLYASNGILLADGITNDAEYAIAWNTLRVPYEAGIGKTTLYLNPVSRTGLYCGDSICGFGRRGFKDPGDNNQYSCHSCLWDTGRGMFRISSFNTYTIKPCSQAGNNEPCIPDAFATKYNYPGVIFDVLGSNRNRTWPTLNGVLD